MNRLVIACGIAVMLGALVTVGLVVKDFSQPVLERYSDNPTLADQQLNDLVLPIIRLEGHVDLPNGRRGTWRGSGVIIYSEPNEVGSGYDSYVLTCNHCVEIPVFDPSSDGWNLVINDFEYGIDYIEIFDRNLRSNRKVPGVVVLQSNNNVFSEDENGDLRVSYDGNMRGEFGEPSGEDLALVRLLTDEPLKAVKVMPLEDVNKLKLFFRARVVGCSLGMKPYHTFGEITRLEGDFMSVSAPFVPGNSGGACFLDSTHEFIGITNAGIPSAPHLGLIRPLEHIYSWMLANGYEWIYDKKVTKEDKFDQIRRDKAAYSLDLFTQNRELRSQIETLNNRVKDLSDAILHLHDIIQALKLQIRELKQLKENIVTTTRNIIGIVLR